MSFPTIPPHSLIAFGLFLRLPGYAEVLLKERKKAQCLLRLVLGVTDDGDGGMYVHRRLFFHVNSNSSWKKSQNEKELSGKKLLVN